WCQEKRALQHAYDTVVLWLAERWLDATYREIRLEANLKKHHPYFFNNSEVVWWMEPREKLEHPFGDIPLSRLRTEKSNSTPQTVYINTKKSLLQSSIDGRTKCSSAFDTIITTKFDATAVQSPRSLRSTASLVRSPSVPLAQADVPEPENVAMDVADTVDSIVEDMEGVTAPDA
ncbi:hypothetical protein BJ508DRAFT_336957, partial [Ascobolus immersus RN42]